MTNTKPKLNFFQKMGEIKAYKDAHKHIELDEIYLGGQPKLCCKACIEQGKLEQSLLSEDKSLGKNEMTAKELVDAFENLIRKTDYRDEYGEQARSHDLRTYGWLKSQLSKDETVKE